MTPLERFGRNLLAARRAAGLTQAQLADAIEAQQSHISKWERGELYPTVSMLISLAGILGVNLHQLLIASEVKATLTKQDPRLVRMGNAFTHLAPTLQAHVYRQVMILYELQSESSAASVEALARADKPLRALQAAAHPNPPAAGDETATTPVVRRRRRQS